MRLGGFFYIAIALAIGLAALNSQANLLFWTFGLMLAGIIVSGVVSGFMVLNLKIRRITPEHGAVDQPMTLHYELINDKRMLPCFSLVLEELDHNDRLRGRPHAFCLHVGPGAIGRADAVAWPLKRGEVRFQRIRIGTSFPFGILRKCVIVDQPSRTVVYPKIHPLDRRLLTRLHARDPDGSRATHDTGGGEEFFGLREYRDGDSLRFVHWRHSARIGQLVSREMTRLSPPRVMVVLDVRNRPLDDDQAEQAISFAASLLNSAYRANDEVGLVVAGARCPSFRPQHSRWHQMRMLQALGELKLGETDVPPPALPAVRDVRWIVIHPEQVDPTLGPRQAIHLTADDLERYRIAEPTTDPPTETAGRPATVDEHQPESTNAAHVGDERKEAVTP